MSPVVMLLIAACVASFVLQEFAEGVVVLLIVTLNACFATQQEMSAGDAVAKLKEMAAAGCKVMRDSHLRDLDQKIWV